MFLTLNHICPNIMKRSYWHWWRLLRNRGLTWLAIIFSLELISTISNTSLNRELALLLNRIGSQSCWIILLWWSTKKGEKIELLRLFLECNLLLTALPKMLHFILLGHVFHMLRTYVMILCNWLTLWQNALYLYLGRLRMCLNTLRNHVSRTSVEAFKSVQEIKQRMQIH